VPQQDRINPRPSRCSRRRGPPLSACSSHARGMPWPRWYWKRYEPAHVRLPWHPTCGAKGLRSGIAPLLGGERQEGIVRKHRDEVARHCHQAGSERAAQHRRTRGTGVGAAGDVIVNNARWGSARRDLGEGHGGILGRDTEGSWGAGSSGWRGAQALSRLICVRGFRNADHVSESVPARLPRMFTVQ